MGSAGLRALVVLSDASCVGRESLHACCEFAGIDALLVKKNASNKEMSFTSSVSSASVLTRAACSMKLSSRIRERQLQQAG